MERGTLLLQDCSNVEALFRKYHVGEIDRFLRKLEAERVALRRDLSILVGQHYSKILEAADAVGLMRVAASEMDQILARLDGLIVEGEEGREKEEQEREKGKGEEREGMNAMTLYDPLQCQLFDSLYEIWEQIQDRKLAEAAKSINLLRQQLDDQNEITIGVKNLTTDDSPINDPPTLSLSLQDAYDCLAHAERVNLQLAEQECCNPDLDIERLCEGLSVLCPSPDSKPKELILRCFSKQIEKLSSPLDHSPDPTRAAQCFAAFCEVSTRICPSTVQDIVSLMDQKLSTLVVSNPDFFLRFALTLQPLQASCQGTAQSFFDRWLDSLPSANEDESISLLTIFGISHQLSQASGQRPLGEGWAQRLRERLNMPSDPAPHQSLLLSPLYPDRKIVLPDLALQADIERPFVPMGLPRLAKLSY